MLQIFGWGGGRMRRIARWAFYAVSFLAILYLALYGYAMFRGQRFEPGNPIHLFFSPEAPGNSFS